MFGLTQYNGNGALMATTGFMLTPLASALNRVGYSVSRDEEMPSIAPAEPNSEWSEWLTSGYVGDFLGWTGKQLAEVGRDLFPELSIPERQRRMKTNKEELKSLLAEFLLRNNKSVEVELKIREVLRMYLREGVALMGQGVLEPELWKEELLSLETLSERAGQTKVARVFAESIEQIGMLLGEEEAQKILVHIEERPAPRQAWKIAPRKERRTDKNELMKKEGSFFENETRASEGEFSNNYWNRSLNSTVDLGALGSAGFTVNGVAAKDDSGYSVSGAGDVNGDGVADILIGARYASPPGRSRAGQSYVVFGGTSLAGSVIDLNALGNAGFTVNGAVAGDYFGASVSGAGDVNGDGVADILIGAWNASPSGRSFAGQSYVVFGGASLAGSVIDLNALGNAGFTVNGADWGDSSGRSVSGAGDVNGDGLADILIGAPSASPSGRSFAGQSYVVFGAKRGLAGSVIDLNALGNAGFTVNGAVAGDGSGWSVSGAGDVNGDGVADILIGALQASPSGRSCAGQSYVVFGAKRGLAGSVIDLNALGRAGFTMNGAVASDFSGLSVSGAGDVNGDGVADILIGAPDASPSGRTRAGQSYVVFGAKRGLAGSVIDLNALGNAGFTMNGAVASDFSGLSVSGAGDVNGDGVTDILIGAPDASPSGRIQAGQSYVVFGGSGLAGSVIDFGALGNAGFTVNGAVAKEHSGYLVSGTGDVNGDGVADILIGAQYASLSPSSDLEAGHANDYSGLSVSGAGDVNKDGFADVIIGEPSAYGDAKSPGVSYVVFGSTSTTPIPTSISKEKQTHLERNFIISGVIASGLLTTGLFCFFYKKKYGNDLDHVKEDELMLLNQDQSTNPETHTDTEKLQM